MIQETKEKVSSTVPKEAVNKVLKIKALISQLDCEAKNIQGNIEKAQRSLVQYSKKDELDLVLFPEMAFSGYTFKDRNDILGCVEESMQGPVYDFCSQLASSLNAYVACGYAELYQKTLPDGKNEEHFYNSAYLIGRDGNLVLNHRQKHLFEADKTWAEEGSEFSQITLKNTQGIEFNTSLAICMDINPYEFLDNSAFELGNFLKINKIDVVLFLSAWNDHEPGNTSQASIDGMLDYWIYRLYPIVNQKGKQPEELYQNFLFLCSDRVGVQMKNKKEKTHYIGCSCALKLNPFQKIYVLPKKSEGFMVAQTFLNL